MGDAVRDDLRDFGRDVDFFDDCVADDAPDIGEPVS